MNYNTRKMKKKNVTTMVYNDIDTRVAVKTKSSGIYFIFFIHKKVVVFVTHLNQPQTKYGLRNQR